jgi:hypothetical protein
VDVLLNNSLALLSFVLVQNSGGGEVSGGGTLYMKWGAGRSSTSRVLKARAGEKLTHTYIFTHILSPTHP